MGIVQTIASKFGYQKGGSPVTTETGQAIVDQMLEYTRLWSVRDDRVAIHNDIEQMDDEDEIIATILDAIATYITSKTSPFEKVLTVESEDEKMKKQIEEIIATAEFEKNVRPIARNAIAFGNDYWEFIVDSAARFTRLKWLAEEHRIIRNQDQWGRLKTGDPNQFKTGECAFEQQTEYGSPLIGFWPWQIVQFRNGLDKYGYGVALFKSARKNYKRLAVLEDSMAIAMLIRAYMKLVHKVPIPVDADLSAMKHAIKDYKKQITKKRILGLRNSTTVLSQIDDPYSVQTDFYVPDDGTGRGGVESIDPSNAQLQNLSPIEYFRNKLIGRGGVPKAYLAFEEDVNAKATLGTQDLHFARIIGGYQGRILVGVDEVIKRSLFLQGVDIKAVQYSLALPSPFKRDEFEQARIDALQATAAEKDVKNKVISRQKAREVHYHMSEEEAEEEQERIEKEVDALGDPSGRPQGLFASATLLDHEILESLAELKHESNGSSRKDILSRRESIERT